MDARRNFVPETPKVMSGDIMFADFMEKWLEVIKSSVAVPTFASYSTSVKKNHRAVLPREGNHPQKPDSERHSGVLPERTWSVSALRRLSIITRTSTRL